MRPFPRPSSTTVPGSEIAEDVGTCSPARRCTCQLSRAAAAPANVCGPEPLELAGQRYDRIFVTVENPDKVVARLT
jgi:hypothetical protein